MDQPPPPPPPGDAAAHPLARAAPLAAGARLLLPLVVVLLLIALAVGLAVLGGRWVLFSEPGTLWLLANLPGVEARGVRGALLGDQLQADRLIVRWDGGRQSLTLVDLQASGLRWQWRPEAGTWVAVQAETLAAREGQLVTGLPSGRPLQLPSSLVLPVRLQLKRAQVDTLTIDQHPSLTGITLDGLVLDSRPGAGHAFERLTGTWRGFNVNAEGRIAANAPLALQASASIAPRADGDAPRWAAVLRAEGPAERIALSGTLRGVPRPGHAAPMLDLRAELRPQQAWPLGALHLSTSDLDLAAIDPLAPETRLGGDIDASSPAADAPISISARLTNGKPGRWNEGRLPLSRLEVDLRGSLAQRDRLEATRFDISLADATRGAGRWSGRAVWQGHTLELQTELRDLNPQRLDSRAAAMTLAGPARVTLDGLPSPDPAATTVPPPRSARWLFDLEGKLDAAPQPVHLIVEGQGNASTIDLQRVRATAGAATAELRGLLQHAARGGWTLQTNGSLVGFDPLPWLPGEVGSAWRQGPHRLSGGWQFDLRLPDNAARIAPLALLQSVVGNGKLQIADSLIAGVPLQADVALAYAPGANATLQGQLVLGGNRLDVNGRVDPAGNGQADRWQLELQAERLANLTPLMRLVPSLADWAPRRGTASASLSAAGRWPDMRSEGHAQTRQLQTGNLVLASGAIDWKLDSATQQPLAMQVDLTGLQWGTQKAEHLSGDVRGTLADHRIEIVGNLPLAPPAAASQLLGWQAQAGTRGQLLANGGWTAEPAGGGRWRATIQRLAIGAWDGNAPPAGLPARTAATAVATAPPLLPAAPAASVPSAGSAGPATTGPRPAPANALWAEARDLQAELRFDGQARLITLRAQPGRLRLADSASLRWDDVLLDLTGPRAQIELRADLEPFAVAPLLARIYPEMGWAGDLRLGARIEIKAAERLDAEVRIARADGDLRLASGDGTLQLGLTEARLSLSAHDGVWDVTPSISGRTLGELRGQLRVRTAPEQRWPAADAPIDGALQLRVADLGVWGGWVPPGWRLTGELRSTASIAGRFGAPQYTGELTGSGVGVRNLLQGINVSDGQVAVRLSGDTAQIERFTLRGGDGTITVTGGATLGAAPKAQLQLKAERFRVIGRVDRLLIASGNAALDLSAEQLKLDGRIAVDEGLFDFSRADAPSLDDDVSVLRPGADDERKSADAAGSTTSRRNVAVAVEVDLGGRLRVRGRGLDTTLGGKLRVSSPGGRLAVNGTVTSDSGTYAAYGQKLSIERGILAFSGSPNNPRLDVLALRPNADMRIGVAITGNLLGPRVRLYSEPEMSDTDKLSWLVLGRAPDGLGRTDLALLQRAAVALLSGEGEAPTDTLLRNLGIDELTLRQSDSDVRETVISLGKQLSRRWYVGYERGVNATTGTWQLIYRIAQRFTLRAQSGLDNSLDVIWVWRIGETPQDGVRKSVTVPP